MKIQIKLAVLMGTMLLVLVMLMVAIGTSVINTIIYKLNTDLLALKLGARLEKIEETIQVLADTGAIGIAASVQNAQTDILQQFQAYAATQPEAYYVIAVNEMKMLLQSQTAQGEAQEEIDPERTHQMASQKSGTLNYDQAGVRYFTVYRYFETWDWLIGASLPQTTMFQQRQTYLITVGWASLLVFVGLLTVSYFMGRKMIVQPVEGLVAVARAIAAGNFDQTIQIRQRDEIGMLAGAFQTMQTTIQRVLLDLQNLIQAIQDGQLTTRGNIEGYTGNWRDLMVGVNNLLEALVAPMNTTATYIERLSKSEIPEQITADYNGDFNTIKNNLNMLGADIRNVLQTMKTLSQAIQDGQLATRGDVAAFGGGWRELVLGVNQVVDAFVAPFSVATEAIDRIARGDVPDQLSIEAKGDFNQLKNNLNQLIDNLKKVLQETQGLIHAAQAGRLDSRGNAEAYTGDWRALVVGMNSMLDAFMLPLNVAAESLDRIARGDLPALITADYHGDFNAIKTNVNTLITAMRDITWLAEEMASGNLSVEVRERSEQDSLMHALNTMSQQLRGIVTQITSAANNVAMGSQQMSLNAEQMSEGAANQSAASEEASSSMEQMAANIKQNTDNALQTEKIALQSVEYAEEGGRVVAETVLAMQQITQKISIIQDIAQQTRLLSLNATIEAARAQEHGKAFSVVASEVRTLSDTTRIAAEEIDELATSSRAISERAGEMLAKLVPNIRKTAELVQEISAASREQNSGAEQINSAIQQLDQVTQGNSAASEELAAVAEELASQAIQLQQTIAFFKVRDTLTDSVDAETGPSTGFVPSIRIQAPTPPENQHRPRKARKAAAQLVNTPAGDDTELDAEFERY